MKLQHNQYIIAACGVAVSLALVLFPEWNAVHPGDDLTMSLGNVWIFFSTGSARVLLIHAGQAELVQ